MPHVVYCTKDYRAYLDNKFERLNYTYILRGAFVLLVSINRAMREPFYSETSSE